MLRALKRLFIFAVASCSLASADPELDRICKTLDAYDAADESVALYRKWALSDQGKKDVLYLAEHYASLSEMRRYNVPKELARTGLMEVEPLVSKALVNDGRLSVMSGIYYACHMNSEPPAYGKKVAPLIIPLLGKESVMDRSFELLIQLDRELAAKTLFSSKWLGSEEHARTVIEACNECDLPIPMEQLQPLLTSWKQHRKANPRLYASVLSSFAHHQPNQAIAEVEAWIKESRTAAEYCADVYLAAAGLTTLYDRLINIVDEPKDLERLPKPAQLYYAATCFHYDWDNGGIDQAFSNSTGDLWPLVKEAYETIGARYSSAMLAKACAEFSPELPSTNRKQRNAQMEKRQLDLNEKAEKWREELKPLRESPEHLSESLLLARYAYKNAEVLRPLVK